MTKPKNPDTDNPAVNQAASQGQVNTQVLKDSLLIDNDNFSDQSEGAKAEGQPTSHQGRGAGFSRNVH